MKTTKQKLKEDFKLVLMLAALAFLVGSVMDVGRKTMNNFWPDKPIQIEYTIKAQAHQYWPTDVPMKGQSNAGI